MSKSLVKFGVIFGIVLLLFTFVISCENIDAGNIGIKVNKFGTGRGVSGVTECTGTVFYSPITTSIKEFPINIRHKEYIGDDSFVVNSKDGSEFHVSPIVNYRINPDKATQIFAKYRKDLDGIESGFLKTAVTEAFRIVTNSYTADQLISSREAFDTKVKAVLRKQLQPEGFELDQFTTNLEYPASFKNAINAKNNAVQKALMAENRVKQAQAEAKIKVATAAGDAEATLTRARAEAEANKLKQATLTPMLIQQQWIDAWKYGGSKVPTYIANGGERFMMNVK
jgi:regulator of protease activity HflC (stomatin/prohibitin superfamily)